MGNIAIRCIFVACWLLSVDSSLPSFNAPKFPLRSLTGALSEINQEVIMKSRSVGQFRSRVLYRLKDTLREFGEDQETLAARAQKDFKQYQERFATLYNDSRTMLDQQRSVLKELDKTLPRRPPAIDDSLEKFRQLYNETALFEYGGHDKSLFQMFTNPAKAVLKPFAAGLTLLSPKDPFRDQLDATYSKVKDNYLDAMKVAGDVGMRADKIYQDSMNSVFDKQTDLLQGAKDLVHQFTSSKGGLKEDVDVAAPVTRTRMRVRMRRRKAKGVSEGEEADNVKRDINRERRTIERQIRRYEKDGADWIEQQKQSFEAQFKALQTSFKETNTAYEELISKRKASIYYTQQNDANLNRVLNMIEVDGADSKAWQFMKEEAGYSLFRRFFKSVEGSKGACVMVRGVVNASPKKILALFEDDTRRAEYNNMYLRGEDLEYVADNTKIQWACTPPVFPLKARDFVTLVHIRKLKDGTLVYLNTPSDHRQKPPGGEGFVRGRIVLAANIMQPIKGKPNQCDVTMMTQLDLGGFAPAPIVNKLCLSGPIGFMKNLEVIANKAPSRKVMKAKKKLEASRKKEQILVQKQPQ